jgi:hypothetical protein
VSCAWHFFATVLGWSGADSLAHTIGWLTFPLGFIVGLAIVAVSVVLAFRRRLDWRVFLGFLLGIWLGVLDVLGKLKGTGA